MKYVSVQIGNYTILQKKKKKKETKNRMKKKKLHDIRIVVYVLGRPH